MAGKPWKFTDGQMRAFHARHIAGESVLALARVTGIDRRSFYLAWKNLGLVANDRSAAANNRHSKATKAELAVLTEAAHVAARGRVHSEAEKIRHAQKTEGRIESAYERIVFDALRDAGFPCIVNMAVGAYRVDIALPERMLAVEIDGGGWHGWGRKLSQDKAKSESLTAAGWDILRLTGNTEHRFRCHADDLIAWLRGSGRRPPIARVNGTTLRID